MIKNCESFRGGPCLCVFVAAVLFTSSAMSRPAQGWSQWRGRDRDGVVHDVAVPDNWPEQLYRRWQVEVGTGHATPVVAGSWIYVHTRSEESNEEVVSALQLSDGQVVWQHKYPTPYRMHPAARAFGKGPVSTPVVAKGRLFTLGKTGMLSCYESETGRLLWQNDFSGQFAVKFPLYGTGMSPMIDSNKLIVHLGGPSEGSLMALDPVTGESIWTLEGDGPSYVSPIVVELEGQRQLVTQTEAQVIGVAVDSGKLLWRLPLKSEFDQNVVTPVVHGDMLIFSALHHPLFAVRLSRDGDSWTTQELWNNPSASLYMSTPVFIGNRLFGMSHRRKGQFFALDVNTGETIWASEGREGQNAAFLVVGNVLVILTEEAEMMLVEADATKLAPIRRYTVANSQTWAHPVLTSEGFLIKDLSGLALWAIDG